LAAARRGAGSGLRLKQQQQQEEQPEGTVRRLITGRVLWPA
jgi:hypothetical protein